MPWNSQNLEPSTLILVGLLHGIESSTIGLCQTIALKQVVLNPLKLAQ